MNIYETYLRFTKDFDEVYINIREFYLYGRKGFEDWKLDETIYKQVRYGFNVKYVRF